MRVDATLPVGRIVTEAVSRRTGRVVLRMERDVYTEVMPLSEALLDIGKVSESIMLQPGEELHIDLRFLPNY